MRTDPGPPRADPHHFPKEFRGLAKPLYELVNQEPISERFPHALKPDQVDEYRRLLKQLTELIYIDLELVSCKRVAGLSGRTAGWMEYLKEYHRLRQHKARPGFDLQEIVECMRQAGDMITLDTDPRLGILPDDLLRRTAFFYRTLQLRGDIPPLGQGYGELVCTALGRAMATGHDPIVKIFPYLVRNPPLGLREDKPMVYRVLVA
jgi:hypothetical protein